MDFEDNIDYDVLTVMPYVYSNFGELPNMGLIHPSKIKNLPPININKVEPPKGLYDIS